jgi:hypothetical protein
MTENFSLQSNKLQMEKPDAQISRYFLFQEAPPVVPSAAIQQTLPDFLTCGTCLAHFRLEHIHQFIQHKVARCSTTPPRPAVVFAEDSPPASPPPKLCCSLCQLEPKSPESLLIHLRDEHNVRLY